jgi:integrase
MKGHVTKKGSRWYFVLDVPNEDGKRKQKWFSSWKTQREAEAAMNKTINEINVGNYIEPSKEKYKDFILKWIEIHKKNIRPNTYETYIGHINNYIIPGIGHIPLDKLNAMHIEHFYDSMSKGVGGISKVENSTIIKTHMLIKASLKYAHKKDMVKQNVAEKVDSPKNKKTEMDYWTKEEASNFLKVANGERLYVTFLLALTTGMNQSELLGLRWRDIDIENGYIHVRQVLDRKGNIGSPKTKSRKRAIALDEITIETLKLHRRTILEEKMKYRSLYKDHDLVNCTRYGTPINYGNINRIWERLREHAVKTYGVKHIRFYDLRHTHATLMLIQGVHPKVVAERLGHSSTKQTLDTYSHVIPGMQMDAAREFGKSIFQNTLAK